MFELGYKVGQCHLIDKMKKEIGEILESNEGRKDDMILVDLVSFFRNLKPIEYDQSKSNAETTDQSNPQGNNP